MGAALKKIAFRPLFSQAYKNLLNAGEEITEPALKRAEAQRLFKAVSRGNRIRRMDKFKRTTRDLALPTAGLGAIGIASYSSS